MGMRSGDGGGEGENHLGFLLKSCGVDYASPLNVSGVHDLLNGKCTVF